MDAVKEGHKTSLSSGKIVALAAGLSVGATLGYIIYRHINGTKSNQGPNTEVSKMTLPIEVYRNMYRCQATFLDMVTEKSGAQVRVMSDSGDHECRGGESLKQITRTTGAKVACSKEPAHGVRAKGMVTITGTRQEVKKAQDMILEKVTEDVMVRTTISQSSARRQKRGHIVVSQKSNGTETEPLLYLNNNSPFSHIEENALVFANGTTGEPETFFDQVGESKIKTASKKEGSTTTKTFSEVSKFEIASPDLSFQPDEHLEVYVSASENPNHFWIQILGVRSIQLDKLTEEMNHFYNNGNSTDQRVDTIVVGDIVAAPYRDHGTWNRARVLGVLGSGLVDLYYVDFGDNGELPRSSLRRMRSDFLSLPFQAIECSLAGVKPKGGVWTEEALDQFERLTYCASWRPLQAKLCSYSHSEISSWPSVKLYDNSEGKAVDVGEELIRLGYAVIFHEDLNGKKEGCNLGCLQMMLDDVIGASSELSLSCISLSEAASISGSVDDVVEDELL
ncbi:tudor and KH domain-containing protein isoform X2 [Neolamprologus brichardi]|uniref:tudor and KH domain-containing protein isoform X2 n=1 Tax=Neolamprologus brichardi TaxID=32507 RepID=UPI001643EB37|nr:tudor and KH domain-containing protein isoform X2 [Neolamprologus brichardi]